MFEYCFSFWALVRNLAFCHEVSVLDDVILGEVTNPWFRPY